MQDLPTWEELAQGPLPTSGNSRRWSLRGLLGVERALVSSSPLGVKNGRGGLSDPRFFSCQSLGRCRRMKCKWWSHLEKQEPASPSQTGRRELSPFGPASVKPPTWSSVRSSCPRIWQVSRNLGAWFTPRPAFSWEVLIDWNGHVWRVKAHNKL